MLTAARRGFSLAEIITALIIIALLAAVMIPTVGGRLRQSQATAIANEVENLTTAITAYRQNVLKYPFTLDILTVLPTTSNRDICNQNMVATNINKWQGPYLARPISGNFPIGDATVENQLIRVPAGLQTGVGTLQIKIDAVDTVAAVQLEAQFDGNADFTTGTIIWTRTTAGIGDLLYSIPIRGC